MYSSLRSLLPPRARPEFTVFALGPDLDLVIEGRGQAGQGLDGRRSEGQRVAFELIEHRELLGKLCDQSLPCKVIGRKHQFNLEVRERDIFGRAELRNR